MHSKGHFQAIHICMNVPGIGDKVFTDKIEFKVADIRYQNNNINKQNTHNNRDHNLQIINRKVISNQGLLYTNMLPTK